MKKNNAFLKSSIIFISILLIISIVFLLWEMNPFIKEATVSFEKGSPASSTNYNSCAVVLFEQLYEERNSEKFFSDILERIQPLISFIHIYNTESMKKELESLDIAGLSGAENSGMITLSTVKIFDIGSFSPERSSSFFEGLFKQEEVYFQYGKISAPKKEIFIGTVKVKENENEKEKTQRLREVFQTAMEEFNSGNAVIIGGDWGYNLPGINRDYNPLFILTPEAWKWVYYAASDDGTETEHKKQTGFLLSPDIQNKGFTADILQNFQILTADIEF